MAEPTVTATAATSAVTAAAETMSTPLAQRTSSMMVEMFGYQVNLMGVAMALLAVGILYLFWSIQRSNKLDFADMVTKDGHAVSLTKVLQLVGGLTATWVMIKLTLTGGLTEALFGLYLTYVGAIEGYSKFVAAKYNYNEKSVKQAKSEADDDSDPSLKPPKV